MISHWSGSCKVCPSYWDSFSLLRELFTSNNVVLAFQYPIRYTYQGHSLCLLWGGFHLGVQIVISYLYDFPVARNTKYDMYCILVLAIQGPKLRTLQGGGGGFRTTPSYATVYEHWQFYISMCFWWVSLWRFALCFAHGLCTTLHQCSSLSHDHHGFASCWTWTTSLWFSRLGVQSPNGSLIVLSFLEKPRISLVYISQRRSGVPSGVTSERLEKLSAHGDIRVSRLLSLVATWLTDLIDGLFCILLQHQHRLLEFRFNLKGHSYHLGGSILNFRLPGSIVYVVQISV